MNLIIKWLFDSFVDTVIALIIVSITFSCVNGYSDIHKVFQISLILLLVNIIPFWAFVSVAYIISIKLKRKKTIIVLVSAIIAFIGFFVFDTFWGDLRNGKWDIYQYLVANFSIFFPFIFSIIIINFTRSYLYKSKNRV